MMRGKTIRLCWICAITCLTIANYPCAAKAESAWNYYVQNASVDITGDGKPEKISLQRFKRRYGKQVYDYYEYFRLTINDKYIFDRMPMNRLLGFSLVNIDRSDKYKEIKVVSPTDPHFTSFIYWFDGRNIRRVGNGWFGKFRGNGLVGEFVHLGFGGAYVDYRLQSDHTLKQVPRKYHRMNKTGIVKAPNLLYASPGSSKVVGRVDTGQKATVVKSDLKQYWLVRAQNGSVGWLKGDPVVIAALFGLAMAG